jgi:hypothetical protein
LSHVIPALQLPEPFQAPMAMMMNVLDIVAAALGDLDLTKAVASG